MTVTWPADHEIVRCNDPDTGEECWFAFLARPLESDTGKYLTGAEQDLAAKSGPGAFLLRTDPSRARGVQARAFPKKKEPPLPWTVLQEPGYAAEAKAMTQEIQNLFADAMAEAGNFEPALRLLHAAMAKTEACIPLPEDPR